MNKTVGLRPALLVYGVYSIIVGVLLIFPALGSRVFDYDVKDPAVASGWGVTIFAFGILGVVMAGNVEQFGRLAWVLVVGLLITSFDLLYFWVIQGLYTARNVIVPIIINALLIAWIWSVRPKS